MRNSDFFKIRTFFVITFKKLAPPLAHNKNWLIQIATPQVSGETTASLEMSGLITALPVKPLYRRRHSADGDSVASPEDRRGGRKTKHCTIKPQSRSVIPREAPALHHIAQTLCLCTVESEGVRLHPSQLSSEL